MAPTACSPATNESPLLNPWFSLDTWKACLPSCSASWVIQSWGYPLGSGFVNTSTLFGAQTNTPLEKLDS